MGLPYVPTGPVFAITPVQAAFGTILKGLVPPYPGPGNAPLIYGLSGNTPNWFGNHYTHITSCLYTTAGTAHSLYFLRPFNFTTVASAAAAAQAVINVTNDPGLYATKMRYPVPGVSPDSNGFYPYAFRVANNAIAASDYCAYQLPDGSWVFDIVASVSTLAITMTANVPTGGVAAGAPFFFFGAPTDSNPQTGIVHLNSTTTASTNKAQQLSPGDGCGIPSLNPGDPLAVLSSNATATGIIDLVSGQYARY